MSKLNNLISVPIIFECKRYKDPVGAEKIRSFRGAMGGRVDRGLFITTSTFTRGAIKESKREGAKLIDLINGEIETSDALASQEIDKENGSQLQKRLKKWILHAQEEGLIVAGALTDAKGDRSLKPSKQSNLDANLRIVEVKENGVVVRGAKLMIAGTAASQEIFILPGGTYREEDKDYALACVIPRDIEGLTIIEATRPSDRRDLEDSSGYEVPDTGATQGLLFFEDVLVPKERVFMCGEYQYRGHPGNSQ